uniref:Uncharacterized protein n=1 Tax=Arundo donax TaxID=35708 RepID=A0A0A9BKH4_ARUDO
MLRCRRRGVRQNGTDAFVGQFELQLILIDCLI